jgi:sugar phosphate isomerase/epimerase
MQRKQFIQTSATLFAAACAGLNFDFKKNKPLLAFSTLGCPDWNLQQIVDFSVKHGYNGIEIRGLKRQMDLTKCPELNDNRSTTLQLIKEKGLKFINLGSSAALHFPEGEERKKHLAEAKAFIDLAQQLNCPYIRVFPNKLPKEQDKQVTLDLIAKGLKELGDYAKARPDDSVGRGKNVKVLMETHGDVVWIADIEKIMQSAEHPNVGLVWDSCNMWTITKESPAEAYKRLKKFIYHTHIKDAKLVGGKVQYVRLGQGEVPWTEAFNALSKANYKGYYSFEWEKLWHPELEEPETAFADYPVAIKKYFQ